MSFDFLDEREKGKDINNDQQDEEQTHNKNNLFSNNLYQTAQYTPNPLQNMVNHDKINQDIKQSRNFSNNTQNSINHVNIDKSNHLRNCNNKQNQQNNTSNQVQIEINTPGSNYQQDNSNNLVEITECFNDNANFQQNNASIKPKQRQEKQLQKQGQCNQGYVPPKYTPIQNNQLNSPFQQPPQQFNVQYSDQREMNSRPQWNIYQLFPQQIETKTCIIIFLLLIIVFLLFIISMNSNNHKVHNNRDYD